MFTDWSQTDPHYFYVQGVLFGIVLSIVVQNLMSLIFNKKDN